MHFVKRAQYLDGYRVRLEFEDGSVRDVDLEPYLDGEIFAPLKDMDYFKTLRIEPDLDTIVWDNGAVMSPDFLYEIGKAVRKTAA
jgi:hypothetical protein